MQPILAAGIHGAGNLLSVFTLPNHQIQFFVDSWGLSLDRSEPMTTINGIHKIEIFSGSQVLARHREIASTLSPAKSSLLENTFNVWWDGKLVWGYRLKAFQNSL